MCKYRHESGHLAQILSPALDSVVSEFSLQHFECYLIHTEVVTFEGDKVCCGHPLVWDEGIGDLSVKHLSLPPVMCD